MMRIMDLVYMTVSMLYGGLSILAGAAEPGRRRINTWAGIMMIAGGILIIAPAVIGYMFSGFSVYILLAGLTSIHIAALNNGIKMHGSINIRHHIIRLTVSVLVTVLNIYCSAV